MCACFCLHVLISKLSFINLRCCLCTEITSRRLLFVRFSVHFILRICLKNHIFADSICSFSYFLRVQAAAPYINNCYIIILNNFKFFLLYYCYSGYNILPTWTSVFSYRTNLLKKFFYIFTVFIIYFYVLWIFTAINMQNFGFLTILK